MKLKTESSSLGKGLEIGHSYVCQISSVEDESGGSLSVSTNFSRIYKKSALRTKKYAMGVSKCGTICRFIDNKSGVHFY